MFTNSNITSNKTDFFQLTISHQGDMNIYLIS